MGGFYLYNNSQKFNLEAVRDVFRKKQLNKSFEITRGHWSIVVYSKLVNRCDCIYCTSRGFIIQIGSVFYKDFPAELVLEAVFHDLVNNEIEYDMLDGHFTLIYCVDNKVSLLIDSLMTKHVFCLQDLNFYSSSMLACCFATNTCLHINKPAVCEKLLTGMILAPDTVVNEVKCIDRLLAEENNEKTDLFIQVVPNNLAEKPNYESSVSKGVQEQIDTLESLMKRLKENIGNETIDTGLSAGYDSRLLLALLHKYFPNSIHTHTHDTKGVHEKEKKYAIEIANCIGVVCDSTPTVQLNDVENLEALIQENLYFFDGRSSFVIGGFSQTYTTEYRTKATNKARIMFTGVGGEIYRNYYHVSQYNKKLIWYLEKYIIDKKNKESILDDELRRETFNHYSAKLENRLSYPLDKMKGFHFFRRFYGEIMMADGQGVMLDAYNQVADCFAPFISPNSIQRSYEDLKLIGIDGSFEAAMINVLNHDLASLPSGYGHNMLSIPFSYKFKQFVRGRVSKDTWEKIAALIPKYRSNIGVDVVKKTLERNRFYIDAMAFFHRLVPEIKIDQLNAGKYGFKTMSFLACTLYLLKDKIEE